MEQNWSYEAWKPTIAQTEIDLGWDLPSKEEVKKNSDLLILRAKDVADRCYFPWAWVERGDILFKLGYPDLSAGDALRAIRLCAAGLRYDSELGNIVRFDVGMWDMIQNSQAGCWAVTAPAQEAQERVAGYLQDYRRKAYKLLISALYATKDDQAAMDICREAQTLYPDDLFFARILEKLAERSHSKLCSLERKRLPRTEIQFQMSVGCISMRQYPWARGSLFQRGPDLISKSNAALKSYSNCIQIRPSSIGASGKATGDRQKANCLGYFATRNIREGEWILTARTALGVCSQQMTTCCYNCSEPLSISRAVTFPCCPKMRFCSVDCRKISEENYHKTLCGHDFGKIYKDAESATAVHQHAVCALFWLRLLACCVQEGSHPLETMRMARLVAQYKLDTSVAWSFRTNVITPLDIVESLGIDVYADSRYDCWVLETMWHRIKNNCSGYSRDGTHCFDLNEYYAIFNHSCQFPPMIGSQSPTSTAIWAALCPIRKGEEVLTTYLGMTTEVPKQKRQEMLMQWLGQKCTCAICLAGND